MCKHCRELGIRRPRNKYSDVAETYLSYCKKSLCLLFETEMQRLEMQRLFISLV